MKPPGSSPEEGESGMSDRTDADLIRDSLDDPELFGQVFSRHFESVFSFVARRAGRDAAADLASEVFVRAFRARHRYDPTRPTCLPWLYGIAVNVVGDRIRRLRRHPRSYLHLAVTEDFDDAEDRLVAATVVEEIRDGLSRLTQADRDTFLLFALEDLSYSEIAVVLGIPIGTVGSRISRARRILREQISGLRRITDKMERESPDNE